MLTGGPDTAAGSSPTLRLRLWTTEKHDPQRNIGVKVWRLPAVKVWRVPAVKV